MESNNLKRKIAGTIFAVSISLGLGIASSVAGQAQSRDQRDRQERSNGQVQPKRDDNRGRRVDPSTNARQVDRNDRNARVDRNVRIDRNVRVEPEARRRDRDDTRIENRNVYRSPVYGYPNVNRYPNVYRNSGNYGYGNNSYQLAQNQGYQDGVNTGASDANQGQTYNPQRSHYYQNATYGYNSSYGNKDSYRQAYRNGFVNGYEAGFRQYNGYGRASNNGPYYQDGASGNNTSGVFGAVLGSILGRP